MANDKQKPDEASIKSQQAGRRLSGNDQEELTSEQNHNPENVDEREEQMKKDRKERPTRPAGPTR